MKLSDSRLVWLGAFILICAGLLVAGNSGIQPARNLPVVTGEETSNGVGVALRGAPHTLDTPIGTLYQAGDTWYDTQHNGTAGKMIGVDNLGYAHMVWTRGANASSNPRHVYYNVWDPIMQDFGLGTGMQVNGTTRAGFTCLALLPSGWCFPADHETVTGYVQPLATGSIDFMPYLGAFTNFRPAPLYENGSQMATIWPKIAVGRDSTLHLVATENPSTGLPGIAQRIYYARGIPQWWDNIGDQIVWQSVDGANQLRLLDTLMVISPDVAASQVSDRVAIAYTHPRHLGPDANQFNNDVFLLISPDGGLTWNPPVNLTNFTTQDTLRAYTDVSVLFDDDDVIHVAFTTGWYDELAGLINVTTGLIWHWDELHQQFSPIAKQWSGGPFSDLGAWQRMVQRPSLAQDLTTGWLYCSYQQYDTTVESYYGYPMGEAYLSVSTDGGQHWAVGTNVTDTQPAQNPAPQGGSLSERDITLADRITYADGVGYAHLEYMLDREAGTTAQFEGVATLNPVYYQQVPIDQIPTAPLMPWEPLHNDGQLTGRCCYDFGNSCEVTTRFACDALGGAWDSSRTCATPCAELGRCCYGGPFAPQCMTVNEDFCAAIGGDWTAGITCEIDPCPVIELCTCADEPFTHCNREAQPIPDGGAGAALTIFVPAQYHITDVNVCFDVTHPHIGDLRILLTSPWGETRWMDAYQGLDSNNFACVGFDDEAADSLAGDYPPYQGSYIPMEALSNFDDENAYGNWVLQVIDDYPNGQAGTLNWACLSFTFDRILPVELASFAAVGVENGVRVSFATASENNNAHFEIWRGTAATGEFRRAAVLPSQGNSASGHSYAWLDETTLPEVTYWYFLVDVALDGERTEHRDRMASAGMAPPELPTEYSLAAYPNPFNPATTLTFGLPEAGRVRVAIFDVNGRQIELVTDRNYTAGHHRLAFTADGLPTGVYFARLESAGVCRTFKLLLLK